MIDKRTKSLATVFFILSFLVGATLGFRIISGQKQETKKQYILIGKEKIAVEIANTSQKITEGLSGRSSMAEDSGMLFLMPQLGNPDFWMKGMMFDLDFVFLRDGQVVELIGNVPYPKGNDDIRYVKSVESFNQALELNAGMIKKLEIKVGQKIEYGLF